MLILIWGKKATYTLKVTLAEKKGSKMTNPTCQSYIILTDEMANVDYKVIADRNLMILWLWSQAIGQKLRTLMLEEVKNLQKFITIERIIL